MASQPHMDLLYLCEARSEQLPPAGWVWRPLDAVTLEKR